jgi:uncharacterized protein
MINIKYIYILLISFLQIIILYPVHSQTSIPVLQGYITDPVGFLAPTDQSYINNKLQSFETKTGSQIFIIIVDSIGTESIEDYSQKVFESWKPGRKGIDDGVLFVIVTNDRRMRIHTGYGVEGVLPDALCKRILDRIVAPAFRNNLRKEGISNALDVMILAIEKESLPEVITSRWQADTFADNLGWFIGSFFSILASIILLIRKSKMGKLALLLNIVIWFPILYFLPEILESSILIQALSTILVFIAGFFSIGHFVMTLNTGTNSSDSSDYSSNGSGSSSYESSSSSESSSSDSTSGGGGDSGGGGASSDW